MNATLKPTVDEAFGMMGKMMGSVPSSIEKTAKVVQGLLCEHPRSRQSAMPPEGGPDEETRTLLYLASALAAGKAAPRRSSWRPLHIVRFALFTKVTGEAAPVFDALRELPR